MGDKWTACAFVCFFLGLFAFLYFSDHDKQASYRECVKFHQPEECRK